nr:acetate--CoA ligase [Chloroflexota bacterium]
PGDTRTITYADLHREVQKAANALLQLGITKGDRVAIYMPMIPELPIAMLACARIGAPHTVVFGGFSSEALAGRINDAEAKLVITADGGWRRGKPAELKPAVDVALESTPSVHGVLVVRRLGDGAPGITMEEGRDHWWHDLVETQVADCPPVAVDSEHMLYLLYTSGSTAKPKGIFHSSAGYLLGTSYSHEMIFDIKPDDVYWCAADIGWVTGHSYIVYGPLANATTGVMYEGTPDTPAWDRWWQIIEDYEVTILYCAPTAIRAFMKQGEAWLEKHDLSTLRVLGSVGEPINPEAWMWYREHVGGDRAPVVDTWWQTETGQILITPLPGVTTTKPGSATFPFPGIGVDVVDADGTSVPLGGGGFLVLTRPWPAMLRGIYGDPERYRETYWSRFPGVYFAGDGAKRDEDGYLWLLGRVDDVMNVAGHRISTTEVESALVDHTSVAEAAVVGKKDEVTGQAIFAFVILKAAHEPSEALAVELRGHVATVIGPIARPKHLMFVPDLPKTRSGKIMRRLLRDLAEGRTLGDTTTLADASVVETIREKSGAAED